MTNLMLYSNNCPKCNILKKKLVEKNIPFTENNSIDEMLELGITQMPVLRRDGTLIGFKEAVEWVNLQ